MKSAIRNLTLIVVLGIFNLTPHQAAASDTKVGTTGAQFLKLGSGARPTALGDAFAGVPDDINAVTSNPAGLSTISRSEFVGMHAQWLEGLSYNFGAFVYPTNHGAFAVSAFTLNVDDLQRRQNDETLQGTFEAMDAWYSLSFARNLGPLTSIGLTARHLRQELADSRATGWSSDIGLMRRMRNRPVSFGIAARHLGADVKFEDESDPLPTVVDAGISAHFFRQSLMLTGDIFVPNDDNIGFGIGSELQFDLSRDFRFTLRGGFNSLSSEDGERSGPSFGAGFRFRRIDLDTAIVPYGEFGNTLRTSFRVRF